jgi:hypothetical protein
MVREPARTAHRYAPEHALISAVHVACLRRKDGHTAWCGVVSILRTKRGAIGHNSDILDLSSPPMPLNSDKLPELVIAAVVSGTRAGAHQMNRTALTNIAPDIFRKRLLIEGYFQRDMAESVLRDYFRHITSELGLRT